MYKGATDEVRGWEGDSEVQGSNRSSERVTARVCMREQQGK